METNVYGNMTKYIESLQSVSLNPKHDISELLKMLHSMHHTIENIHGHEQAAKIVTAMASITIAYFKKDSIANNLITKLGTTTRKNSLAAEFAGTFRGVWEWELSDVNNFIVELERMKLLPKEAFDLGDEENVEIVNKKLLGIIPYKQTRKQKTHHYLTGADLRKHFGATGGDITKEVFTKYIPMALVAMTIAMMMKALKEQSDKKH